MHTDLPPLPFSKWMLETDLSNWQHWIWERCHGIDSESPESTVGDPNPQHALIDAYRRSGSPAQQAFTGALKLCLSASVETFKRLHGSGASGEEVDSEYLALERQLAVLHEIDANLVPAGTSAIVRDVYDVVNSAVGEAPLSTRRAVLAARLHVNDRIGEYDIQEALHHPDLFVIGFHAALKEFDIGAIRRFFPQFVATAFSTRQGILAKLELQDLHTSYGCGATTEGQLVREIELAREKMPPVHAQQVAELADAVGIRLHGTKPVREAIRLRQAETGQPTIVILDGNYVQGESYKAFVDEITKYLEEETSSFPLVEPAEKFGWERLATFALKNLFDFCRDPYFNRDPRDRLVDVVRFGSITTFTGVLRAGTALAKGPLAAPKLLFRQRLMQTLQRFDSTVGILGETAAALEVVDVLSGFPKYKAVAKSSAEELAAWLKQEPEKHFVCCDYGSALEIRSHLEQQHLWDWSNPATDDKRLRFSYKTPVPVGFLFPSTDQSWGRDIANGFRKALEGEENIKRWAQVGTELANVGIKPMSAREIALQVFHDRHLAMQCAAWEGDYTAATELRDQLEGVRGS